MTSLSLKKHPTTLLNTWMSAKAAKWLLSVACACLVSQSVLADGPRVVHPPKKTLKSFSTLPTLQKPAAVGTNAAQRPQVAQSPQHAANTGRVEAGAKKAVGTPHDSAYPNGYAALSDLQSPPKAPAADAANVGRRNSGSGTDMRSGSVRQVDAADDDLQVRFVDVADERGVSDTMVESGRVVHRFKPISQITPHLDYSPEGKPRCDNLCPRPHGIDCPDCDSDPENFSDRSCPECPPERRISDDFPLHEGMAAITNRQFGQINYCWEPSNLYHTPIYFEDFALERYGHTRHYLLQPFFSGGLFATQLVGLPYQMTIDPICKKRYVLGWHRPGTYVPPKYYQVPWNTQAAIVQGAAVTGGYYLFAPGVSP